MADWAPVIVGVFLFILLSPGLLFQIPGESRGIEFATHKTSPLAVLMHSFIFLGLYAVLIVSVGLKIIIS